MTTLNYTDLPSKEDWARLDVALGRKGLSPKEMLNQVLYQLAWNGTPKGKGVPYLNWFRVANLESQPGRKASRLTHVRAGILQKVITNWLSAATR